MVQDINERIEHFTEEIHYVKMLKSDYESLQSHIQKLENEKIRSEELQKKLYALYDKIGEIDKEVTKGLGMTNDKLKTTKQLIAISYMLSEMLNKMER